MCGIFGIIGKRNSALESALKSATHALAHRGPDDEGTQLLPLISDADIGVGLGSRRLAILDLSPAGHQPLHDPGSGNWLVFNGEIYNFQEVRAQLERLGHRFASSGDTEVLLKAYCQWGEACLERLTGMFAFAVWNARHERLILARDRLGEKPLYYCSGPDSFLFGSEVRALLATGRVARRLDGEGLASYLAFGSVQEPLTIVDGIRSLPPGHTLTLEHGRCQIRKYWGLAEVAARPPATELAREAVCAIRERLLRAVSQRLVSDVPLGVFLSGGVDSSAIVALARDVRESPIDTFSVVFGDPKFCEAGYSNRVARDFACHHHEINLTETKLLEAVPDAMASMDQPTVDGINTYVVSQAARRSGITVALSGLGGDELFAGYSSFRTVPRMMAFQKYLGWLRLPRKEMNGFRGSGLTNRLAKIRALVHRDYYGNQPYFLARALFLPEAVGDLLRGTTFRNPDRDAAWSLGELAGRVRDLEAVKQIAVLEGATYMANTLLRDTDCMSMAHSLEVRTPLLDHELWEYILPLAGRLKLDGTRPKPLLLSAAGETLAEEIYRRRKMGFTLPFDRWMRNGLGARVERELLDPSLRELLPLDTRRVAEVWAAYLEGRTTWSRPWALYSLKCWVRRNVEEPFCAS